MGKHIYFVWLHVSNIKTGTRRIRGLDELSFVIRLERRILSESSSGRISRLLSVFLLETHNQTKYTCLSKVVQTDNASHIVRPVFTLVGWTDNASLV